MSDAKKLTNRIPFECIEMVHNWSLPSLGDDARAIPSSQRDARRQQDQKDHGVMEDVSDTVVIKPLTAEQLQNITEAAEREGREHGYQDGLQQGVQQGQKQGEKNGELKAYAEFKAQLQDETARLKQIADHLMAPLVAQDAALENLLVEMALKFAEHLLQKALDADPSALYALVERAISGLPAGSKNLRVVLSPEDLALLQSACQPLPENWNLGSDRALERGGCRVESQYSLVDYSVGKRVAQMLEQVRAQGDATALETAPIQDHRPPPQAEQNPETPAPPPEPVSNSMEQGEPKL